MHETGSEDNLIILIIDSFKIDIVRVALNLRCHRRVSSRLLNNFGNIIILRLCILGLLNLLVGFNFLFDFYMLLIYFVICWYILLFISIFCLYFACYGGLLLKLRIWNGKIFLILKILCGIDRNCGFRNLLLIWINYNFFFLFFFFSLRGFYWYIRRLYGGLGWFAWHLCSSLFIIFF